MKIVLAALVLALSLASTGRAADQALTPQQEKMKSCNEQAASKGLKGAERKQFMSGCLKSAPAGGNAALTPQQQKMKSCNTEATSKGLKGEARKTFMSSCLKGG